MVEKEHKAAGEEWVECAKCGGWQHHICALFNATKNKEEEPDYTCPRCYIHEIQHEERVPLPPSAVPGAKELPRTMLSDHIEKRLFASLEQERRERAEALGKSTTEKIEQVDVIVFAMFAQEYGPECDYPNKDSVYISYIDSVKHLRPQIKTVHGEALRTFVFHELLIGYMDYCKRQGLAKCHIWICPPKKKEDYILYCHPDDQNIPTSEKLQNWYQFMIEKAIKGKVAVAFSYLHEHFYGPHSENKMTATNLPFFEGGFFQSITDKVIDFIKKLEERGEREALTSRKRKKPNSSSPDSYENSAKDILLMKKAEVNDIAFDHRDEDGIICNKFIENREEFLKFCVKHRYQFDTLRRAKHSTAMILYHLHEPSDG
ncbi:hypothetical protein Scep_022449 [Stephania cephalantha]|uniref:histone acetyltransferase n=1 Tax=Stephania cephalantha TaxID=152367 RepID=A0AAP0F7Z4_9MAGN